MNCRKIYIYIYIYMAKSLGITNYVRKSLTVYRGEKKKKR